MKLRFLLVLLSLLPAMVDANDILRLASSTSAVNSGLLPKLIPVFEKATGFKVEMQSVGSGNALRMGRAGKVDVVLVHLQESEIKFMQDGHGVIHRQVMKNDYVIAGPKDDPANIKGSNNAIEAFQKIARTKSPFVSRADNSGTSRRELKIWQAGNIEPYGESWYWEVGLGMGASLSQASDMNAYIFTDLGTWLSYKNSIALIILTQDDKRLENIYSVITVNPEHHPGINYKAAEAFADWIVSEPAQQLIADFRVEEEVLFTPLALPIKTAQ